MVLIETHHPSKLLYIMLNRIMSKVSINHSTFTLFFSASSQKSIIIFSNCTTFVDLLNTHNVAHNWRLTIVTKRRAIVIFLIKKMQRLSCCNIEKLIHTIF